MELLTPSKLEQVLINTFPQNATCWSEATDEIRDMCREARLLAEEPENEAVNFRGITSPAEWNTQGIAGTIKFFKLMNAEKQKQFCDRFEDWLAQWIPMCIFNTPPEA